MHIEGMDVTQIVSVMSKFQISPKQFFLLFILESDRREEKGQIIGDFPKKAIQNIYRFAETIEHWTKEEVKDLVEKGLLLDHNTPGGERSTYPDNYEITDLFEKAIFSTVSDFDEFWVIYPGFVDNFVDYTKPMIPLKAVDQEEVERLYRKKAKTHQMHKQVIEALNWAVEENLINMRIDKYVSSKMWEQHLDLRFSQTSGTKLKRKPIN